MSKNLDIEVDQGSVWSVTLIIKDAQKNPIDVSDRTYQGCAKDDYKNPRITIPFTLYKANQTTDKGAVVWRIESDSTKLLKISEPTILNFDIKETFAGNEYTIISGKLTLLPRFN